MGDKTDFNKKKYLAQIKTISGQRRRIKFTANADKNRDLTPRNRV
jgi:hypothetical protein